MRRQIIALLLTSCGYHSGDLDHNLSCAVGCPKPTPSPTVSQSCQVQQATNGAIIICPDGSNALILNGLPGVSGESGPAGASGEVGPMGPAGPAVDAGPYAFTEVKDPCGLQGTFDEILFHMANGDWVAFYSGNGGFLTVLKDNMDYRTTDQVPCYFRLQNGEIINEHN